MSEVEPLDMLRDTKVAAEARFVPLLLSISKSTRALMGVTLAEHGFHNGQDELLIALNEETPISVSHMADVLRVRPSTVSKMLDRLIAKDLAERVGNSTDARRTMVRITPLGIDMRSKLIRVREELERKLIASWPDYTEEALRSIENIEALLKMRLDRLR